MDILDLISIKRDGGELTANQLKDFVVDFAEGKIDDSQTSAFLMAITLNGFSDDETFWLAKAMAESGKPIDLHKVSSCCVDKHSVGGISDVVSLIVMSVLPSMGIDVVKMCDEKMASRTTVDRLKLFNGFSCLKKEEDFLNAVKNIHVGLLTEPKDLVAVDTKLSKLRRITATYESAPLIAASIMSKKLAARPDCLVFDIKCGEGALVKDFSQATILGNLLVEVGKRAGIVSSAVLSNLNQPIGMCVGLKLELRETINLLKAAKGTYANDLFCISRELCTNVLILTGKVKGRGSAYELFDNAIASQKAFMQFEKMVKYYGGDVSYLKDSTLLIPKSNVTYIMAQRDGYVENIDTNQVGYAVNLMGGGRLLAGDEICPDVGVELLVREGEKVKEGDRIARVFYERSDEKFAEAIKLLRDGIVVSKSHSKPSDLIRKILY